jgi:hypothetical protein
MIRRRKGIITLLFILSFFLYVNWFISISNWSGSDEGGGSKRSEQQGSIELDLKNAGDLRALEKGQKSQHILFELFEAYEVNEKIEVSNTANNNKEEDPLKKPTPPSENAQFLLISTKDLSQNQNQVQVILPVKEDQEASQLERQELNFLLKVLSRNKAFIADKRMFDEIRFKDTTLSLASQLESSSDANAVSLAYEILTMSSIRSYLDKDNNNDKSVLLTFGIHYNNAESLNHVNI